MYLVRLLLPVHRQSVCKILSANYSFQNPVKYLEVQDNWRNKDDVSKRYQLIYKAPMVNLLNYATAYLTFSTVSIGGLGAYYAGFVFDRSSMNEPVVLGDDIVIANSGIECFTYLGAFVAFHVAVQVLLSKYVIRLYQDGDNYIAVYRGYWFNSIIKHEFNLKNVQKIEPILAVAWSDARFQLGSKKGILLSDYFKTPEHYNKLADKKETEEENRKSENKNRTREHKQSKETGENE